MSYLIGMNGPASMSRLAGTVKMAVAAGGSTDIRPLGQMAIPHISAIDNMGVAALNNVGGSLASLIVTVAGSGHS
jgi:hypothetical protein